MALEDMLKEHAAFLEKAARQPIFQKISDDDVNFPQALRERRIEEIGAAIEALSRQRAEADARFAAAIESYKQEIDALKSNVGPGTEPRPQAAAPSRASKRKSS